MEHERDRVLRSTDERNVDSVQLWFTDVEGFLVSIPVARAELESVLAAGVDLSGIDTRRTSPPYPPGARALPDPTTFGFLDSLDGNPPRARMFCEVHLPSGEPFGCDPRFILQRTLERARGWGFNPVVSPEIQYFYFRSAHESEPWDPVREGDRAPSVATWELRQETIETLEDLGIPVQYSHYELAPSQQEIDLSGSDALTAADNIVTCRHVVKRVAAARGAHATFMPKPVAGWHGSGMHTKVSLLEGEVNAFRDPRHPYELSELAMVFMAGLLHHAREITAVTNQWVNSYKRLVAGWDAPAHVCWSHDDRSALVRVPLSGGGRIEYRAPDPACNPYLALAVILAAGLRGIEGEYELPAEAAAKVLEMTPEQLVTEGISPLPQSLPEAVEAMEHSELVADALGKDLMELYLERKREEWMRYIRKTLSSGERPLGMREVVTPFEITRYLGLL